MHASNAAPAAINNNHIEVDCPWFSDEWQLLHPDAPLSAGTNRADGPTGVTA